MSDLRSEFPASPSMWTDAPAPSIPAPAPSNPAAEPAPALLPPDELAALQRDYPTSWRSMLPREAASPLEPDAAKEPQADPAKGDAPKAAGAEKPAADLPVPDAAMLAEAAARGIPAEAVPHMLKAQLEHRAEIDGWTKASRADPEVMDALPHAREALREHGSDEVRDLLNSTGLGNHPAVIKLFAKLAKAARGW